MTRNGTRRLSVAAAMVVASWTASAQAAPAEHPRLTASPDGLVATESARVLPAWTPSASLVARHGETLPNGGAPRPAIDRRTTASLLGALGLFNWTELSMELPLTVYQSATRPGDRGPVPVEPGGIGDLRFGLKAGLLPRLPRGFGLGLRMDAYAPTGSTAALTGTGTWAYAPGLLAEHHLASGITFHTDLGFLARPTQRLGDVVLGHAFTYRAGVRAPLDRRRQVAALLEVDGATGLEPAAADPITLRAGFRFQTRSGFMVHLYGGGSPITSPGIPDVEAILGIGWWPGRVARVRPFDPRTPSRAQVPPRTPPDDGPHVSR